MNIVLNNLRIYAYHGAMPQETVVGDWYIINLRLNVSNEQATTTDSLDDTVNYAQVYKIVREEMATPSISSSTCVAALLAACSAIST